MKTIKQNPVLNDAIATVLQTKVTDFRAGKLSKAKKYAIELVNSAPHLIVVTDSDMSEQGYLGIKNHRNGKWIIISKDYEGKSTIYKNGTSPVKTNLTYREIVKKFNYVNYLMTEKYEKSQEFTSKVSEYKFLKKRLDMENRMIAWTMKDIEKAQRDLVRLQNRLKYENENVDGVKKRIDSLFVL